MEHDFKKLQEHILSQSVSNNFECAILEWKLVAIEVDNNLNRCPCGQQIKELCYLENTQNKNKTYVGNVCVNRFIGIDTGNAFAGLKRIAEDITANPNSDLIKHSFELGYIYANEVDFLNSIKRKRKLSQKQEKWKMKINRRIINQTVVAKK